MPLYDFDCEACDRRLIDHCCRYDERNSVECPSCGELMTLHFTPARMLLTGATSSRPIVIGGANVSFESNSEYRAYLKANPQVKIVDQSDSQWRRFKDRNDDDANKMAKRGGYSDINEMRRDRKKERERKTELGG